MVPNPLQNIQHQFKHLPTGIEEFLTTLFEEMPPNFNELFDVKSYGYVFHPGGHYFHTLILKLNPEVEKKLEIETWEVLKKLPHEVDEDVYLFWFYNFGTLHLTITGTI